MFFPDQSLYLASKAAVEQFVRSLAWEHGDRRITVNAIAPGPTETDMMQDRYRQGRGHVTIQSSRRPCGCADIAVSLATDAAGWVTGQNIGASGGTF